MDNVQIKYRIQVVVVLYKCSTTESKSLNSLLHVKSELSDLFDFDILVYNNDAQKPISTHSDYQIYNSTTNSMLAGAYNYALKLAINKQISWLLLLDQDTTLNIQYFKELHNALKNITPKTACIVPIINSQNKHLSPIQYRPNLGPQWFQRPLYQGTHNSCLFAFNSATLINTSAISTIGGFPYEYPLDDLDICYFYRLFKKGYNTHVIPVTIEHQLSILDYAKNMTHTRYQSILDYDKKMANELGKTALIALKIRLFCRIIIQLFSPDKRKYIPQTIKSIVK